MGGLGGCWLRQRGSGLATKLPLGCPGAQQCRLGAAQAMEHMGLIIFKMLFSPRDFLLNLKLFERIIYGRFIFMFFFLVINLIGSRIS